MGTAAIIAAILGVVGLMVNAASTAYSNNKQIEHDKEMAAINLENQKEFAQYQTDLAQSTNTIATQKGHAAAAGYSPAMLYGNMSTPGLQDVTGSGAGGSSSSLTPLQLFNKLPTSEVAQTILTEKQQAMNRERLASDIALNRQKALESAARTAEQTRFTGLQRQLEKTIIDQSLANLYNTQSMTALNTARTNEIDVMLPSRLEAQNLLNSETAARTKKIVSDTLKNSVEMRFLNTDMRRVSAMADYYENMKDTPVAERERIYSEIDGIKESTKRSALGRIMSEAGLNGVKMPPSMRGNMSDLDGKGSVSKFYACHKEQIDCAMAALISCGYSPQEAGMAVCYYVSDSRDVSPSLINGFTRIAAGIVTKK